MSVSALIFVLAFSAGCLLALSRHPIYSLMAYVIVLFVSPSDRWWGQGFVGDMRWSLLAAAVTALAIMIHGHKEARPEARPGIVAFVLVWLGWLLVQAGWSLNPELHWSFIEFHAKSAIAIALIYLVVRDERSIRLFFWSLVVGCTYISIVAYQQYSGGRFDDFGGAGIGDANASALAIVTGIVAAGALFVSSGTKQRVALILLAPIMLNALVATISRSGFLALAVGGFTFFLLGPKRFRKGIVLAGILGLAGFFALTNQSYWERISTIKMLGQEVEQVDTGHKRLLLIQAQWKMFKRYPFGCGSRCTDVLSPQYLDVTQLAGKSGEIKVRSSHNTYMTMLVDHGIPGGIIFGALLLWAWKSVFAVRRRLAIEEGFLPVATAAVASCLAAIFVGDLFVQYSKFELRLWFVALLMVLGSLTLRSRVPATQESNLPSLNPVQRASTA